MYWHSILTFLIWPVLILVSYWLVMLAVKKVEKIEQEHDETSG